jgi:arylsulfatase A-like enzyme
MVTRTWMGALCMLLAWCRVTAAGVADSDRYNIISIVTDDQAHWTVGCYGNPEVRTPHMDRLGCEGAKFLNAFVATPVCSPSRVSFLTGLYGTQVGITDFLCRAEERAGLGLPESAITWPAVLQRHEYATALIGKWHLGTQPQFHPTRHGFNHFFGWLLTPQSIDPLLEVEGQNRQLNLMDELYDLRNDPGEMKNRYEDASVSDVRDQLQQRLEAWMRSIDDPLLRD